MLLTPDGKAKDSETILAGTLRAADALAVMITGYVAYIIREHSIDPPAYYLIAILLSGILTINILQVAKGYTLESIRHPFRGFGRVSVGWLAVFVTLITLSYATKTSADFSRIWFGLWGSMSLVSLFLIRIIAALQVARWHASGVALTRLAIIGNDAYARQVAERIHQQNGSDIEIIGYFAPIEGSRSCGAEHELLGHLDDIAPMVRADAIEELLVAVPPDRAEDIGKIMHVTRNLPISVRLCLTAPGFNLPIRGFAVFGGLPILDVWNRPLSAWDRVLKDLEDRVLAALLIVLLAPMMAVIALMIKLDSPGPVLFRQKRAGFNNDEFTIYKFRSMTADRVPEPGVPQAKRGDPRVTSIGRFLRHTSLDELPQLFNVLKGNMSLVGPRPHALEHDEHYAAQIDEYLGRQRVKPGITGWAQVNGLRGETKTEEDMRRRVQYDLFYIDNWSVLLDLKILVLTLVVGFVNENAY